MKKQRSLSNQQKSLAKKLDYLDAKTIFQTKTRTTRVSRRKTVP